VSRRASFVLLFRFAPVVAVAVCVATCTKSRSDPTPTALHGVVSSAFHGDRARLGWNDREADLTPEAVRARGLGIVWESAPFESATLDTGSAIAAHAYASPLYLDDARLSGGEFDGLRTSVLFAATSSGWVYAVNAAATANASGRAIAPGVLLWQTRLGNADMPTRNLDGVPFGILSTPILDLTTSPPRLYVASADATLGWQAFAIDATNGHVLAGWPVGISDAVVAPVNGNAPPADGSPRATMPEHRVVSQRGALNLSPGGDLLYIPFGSYFDGATGWMVAIDTHAAKIKAAFSGAPHDVVLGAADAGATADAGAPEGGSRCPVEALTNLANAGMWGAGGPAIDGDGRVFVTTGNSPEASGPAPGVWGNSVLQWRAPLELAGAYSPWNYCLLDRGDTDLGGGSPLVFDLESPRAHLVAFSSKQGNVYLADRDHFSTALANRPPCDPSSLPLPSSDPSLLSPTPSTSYVPSSRGPVNVFGPYSDGACDNQVNQAKMRSSPAFFRDARGDAFLFVSGTSKSAQGESVPPCLAKLRVETSGAAPYLSIAARESTLLFKNPGSPIVTSHDSKDAVVWVLDMNGDRTSALVPIPERNYVPPHPILYAVDATSLAPLWKSEPNQLQTGGKYNHPVVAHGVVYVVTDRVQAFGLR
jgi:hypothetical protein